MLKRIMIDGFGLVFPAMIMFVVTEQFPVKPLYPELSMDTNRLYLCLLPCAIYLASRVYFAITFAVTSRIGSALARFPWIETWLNRFLISGYFIIPIVTIPQIQTPLLKIWSDNFGPVADIVYKIAEPQVEQVWAFWKRLFVLITVWFLALFMLELLMRVILAILGFFLRLLFGKKAAPVEEETPKEKED